MVQRYNVGEDNMNEEYCSCPLLSVIIPFYNTSSTIDRCINSVNNQTYSNIEIIVVNDGSVEDLVLQNQDNIKVITHEKNKGLFRARITGFKESRG